MYNKDTSTIADLVWTIFNVNKDGDACVRNMFRIVSIIFPTPEPYWRIVVMPQEMTGIHQERDAVWFYYRTTIIYFKSTKNPIGTATIHILNKIQKIDKILL